MREKQHKRLIYLALFVLILAYFVTAFADLFGRYTRYTTIEHCESEGYNCILVQYASLNGWNQPIDGYVFWDGKEHEISSLLTGYIKVTDGGFDVEWISITKLILMPNNDFEMVGEPPDELDVTIRYFDRTLLRYVESQIGPDLERRVSPGSL